MSTDLIHSHHHHHHAHQQNNGQIAALDEDSSSANDVDMMLDSANVQVHSATGSVVPVPLTKSLVSEVSSSSPTPSSSDTTTVVVMDTETDHQTPADLQINAPSSRGVCKVGVSTSNHNESSLKSSSSSDPSGVHLHHHIHYFYHHHFHHVAVSDSQAASTPSNPTAVSPMETVQSPSISSVDSGSSALVRTISNGSTFGPLSNWSVLPMVINDHKTSSTSDATSQVSTIPSAPVTPAVKPQANPLVLTPPSTPSTPLPALSYATAFNSNIAPSATETTTASTASAPVSEASSCHDPINKSIQSSRPTEPAKKPTLYTTSQINARFTSLLPISFGESFILTNQIEASNLYRCIDTSNHQEYCCKVIFSKWYNKFLAGHVRMNGYTGINQVQKIIVGRHNTFILFSPSYGDLHSYVRVKRRLKEWEAMPLFQQIVQIVADCHANGIILRDLKLRKFVFTDKQQTQLKLETLEGASLFDDDDTLKDKHGCPAYVSPEILNSESYSGMAADCWSIGVILFTMVIGRYPFHDTNPSVVFSKIRRGTFHIPGNLSKQARCLINSLIRFDPSQRLTAEDALAHRWFKMGRNAHSHSINLKRSFGNTLANTNVATAAAIVSAANAISSSWNNHTHHVHSNHHQHSVVNSSGQEPSEPQSPPIATSITSAISTALQQRLSLVQSNQLSLSLVPPTVTGPSSSTLSPFPSDGSPVASVSSPLSSSLLSCCTGAGDISGFKSLDQIVPDLNA